MRLSITDTGCGMDETTRERIFDPFFSTKGDKGTGLGLSQVYGFISRSDGAVKVESVINQGTKLTMYFPVDQTLKNTDNRAEYDDSKTVEGKEAILIVDDEADLLNLTSEMLSQQGYKIFKANRAAKALEILDNEHIDLLLTDIIMPEMDGYELSFMASAKYPEIKIQLVSGFAGEQNIDHINSELSKAIIQKPYRTRDLLRKIRTLLENRH